MAKKTCPQFSRGRLIWGQHRTTWIFTHHLTQIIQGHTGHTIKERTKMKHYAKTCSHFFCFGSFAQPVSQATILSVAIAVFQNMKLTAIWQWNKDVKSESILKRLDWHKIKTTIMYQKICPFWVVLFCRQPFSRFWGQYRFYLSLADELDDDVFYFFFNQFLFKSHKTSIRYLGLLNKTKQGNVFL